MYLVIEGQNLNVRIFKINKCLILQLKIYFLYIFLKKIRRICESVSGNNGKSVRLLELRR